MLYARLPASPQAAPDCSSHSGCISSPRELGVHPVSSWDLRLKAAGCGDTPPSSPPHTHEHTHPTFPPPFQLNGPYYFWENTVYFPFSLLLSLNKPLSCTFLGFFFLNYYFSASQRHPLLFFFVLGFLGITLKTLKRIKNFWKWK